MINKKIFEIQENEQPLDNLKENCGFAGIFKNIGVVGDSLSSGEFESTQRGKAARPWNFQAQRLPKSKTFEHTGKSWRYSLFHTRSYSMHMSERT